MSGFNQAKIDELFFSRTSSTSNFLMNFAYGICDNLKSSSAFGRACWVE